MSLTSCLVLLLLCLSLHACNARARPLAAIDMKVIDQNKFQISNLQVDHEKKISVTSKVESSSSSELGATKEDSKINGDTQLSGDNTQKQKGLKAEQKEAKNKKAKGSGAVPKESLAWRVPQHKPGEKYPGFNLDYSSPKMHPPSHN